MNEISICQGYLTIHISAWSSNSDCPHFPEKIGYWWITPMSNRSSFITDQPIGTSPLSSYPGQTPCSSAWTLFQTRVHRKYDALSCGEKACKIPLWSTKSQCTQVKLITTSFHLHVYEQYFNKE